MPHAGWLLLWSVVLIVLVIVPIVVVFRREARLPPEDIVKRRYARGEIGREDYERLMEDLRKKPEEF
ncbi:MAG TPA: hypothetical protein VIC33_05895 [Vicinamibacterales bacterium]|jgi:putative membrane protein